MPAAPGRAASAWLWLCVGVTLTRLFAAVEPQQERQRQQEQRGPVLSHSEPLVKTRGGGEFAPMPVWKFVEEHSDGGTGTAGYGRPQYRCSNGFLLVRFSLVQHTNMQLHDGRTLTRKDHCQVTIHTLGPLLMLKFPFDSCHMKLWTENGAKFYQIELHYFDHLLQTAMTSVATCEEPPRQLQLPMVACSSSDVTVKLPLGTKLKRVRTLGKDSTNEMETTITTTILGDLLVQMPMLSEEESIFELIYLNPGGEMTSTLAACSRPKLQPRAAAVQPNIWEMWDYEDLPTGPYTPDSTETPETTQTTETTPTTTTETSTTSTTETPTTTTETPTTTTETTTEAPCEEETETPTTTTTTETPTTTTTTETPTTTTETPTTTTTTTTETRTTTELTQSTFSDDEIYEMWGFDETPEGPYSPTTAPPTTTEPPATTTAAPTTTEPPATTTAAPTTTRSVTATTARVAVTSSVAASTGGVAPSSARP